MAASIYHHYHAAFDIPPVECGPSRILHVGVTLASLTSQAQIRDIFIFNKINIFQLFKT